MGPISNNTPKSPAMQTVKQTLKPADKSTRKYQMLILLECLIWGLGNPITKYAYISMTPFCYMAVRFAAAFFVFFIIFFKPILKDLNIEKLKGCVLVGVFMAGAYIFGNLALEKSMVTITGFLMGISVIFTSVFSLIFLRKRLSWKLTVILAVVVAGMYLLCCGGEGSFSFGIGELFGILSSACLAITLMLSAKYIRDVNPVTLSAVQCAVTAVACFIFALLLEDFSCMFTAQPVSWAAMAYLSIGCTVIAFMLQNVSIGYLSPIFVSLAFCTEPLFTAVASYFMLGERLTAIGLIGCVLITGGVVAASLMDIKNE